jgi:hypothetical protein
MTDELREQKRRMDEAHQRAVKRRRPVLYTTWCSMLKRCRCQTATQYKHYGGRGISVCPEWKDFATFKEWALSNGYRRGLNLDRVNNDGNYEPGNCKFVDHSANMGHTRVSVMIIINGDTACCAEWARRIGIGRTAICRWIKKIGMDAAIDRIKHRLNERSAI